MSFWRSKEIAAESVENPATRISLFISITGTGREGELEAYCARTAIRVLSDGSKTTPEHSVSLIISETHPLREHFNAIWSLLEGPLESDNQGSASDEIR